MRKLYVIFLVISLFSCKEKYHYFTVSGRVLNAGNNEPISGANVEINDGIAFGGGVIGSTEESDVLEYHTKTDSTGYFYVQLKTKKEYAYVYATGEKYYIDVDNKLPSKIVPLPEGAYQNKDLYLARWAEFNTFKFKANTPFDSDSVFISNLKAVWGYTGTGKESIDKFTNEVDIINVGSVEADRYFSYKIKYKRDNLFWETKVDSFYVEGNKVYDKVVWF